MKIREVIFLVTALLIFILAQGSLYVIVDAAEAVGDSDIIKFKRVKAMKLAAAIVLVYFLIYYGLCWIARLLRPRSR